MLLVSILKFENLLHSCLRPKLHIKTEKFVKAINYVIISFDKVIKWGLVFLMRNLG